MPCHAREVVVEFHIASIFEDVLHHTLKELQHVFLLYKRHFAVDLSKFGLTVGAKVFVAEALGYLEIAVESALVEITAQFEAHLVTQFQILAHCFAAQVEVTILHSYVVAAIGIVFDGKRRYIALIKDIELLCDDFDIAGGKVFVLARTLFHLSFHLYHILSAQTVGRLAQCGVVFHIKHYLCDAISVA